MDKVVLEGIILELDAIMASGNGDHQYQTLQNGILELRLRLKNLLDMTPDSD